MLKIECKSALLGAFRLLYPNHLDNWFRAGRIDEELDSRADTFLSEVGRLENDGLLPNEALERAWDLVVSDIRVPQKAG